MKLSKGRFRWRRWWCPLWISLGMMAPRGIGFAAELSSTCSPEGAPSRGLPVPELGGSERLIAVRRDGLLGSAWGFVMDCRHPEWPTRMVAMKAEGEGSAPVAVVAAASAAPQVVRAGERVRLWRQDSAARIETSGVAEERGTEGQQIRVRLTSMGANGEVVKDFVIGVVRGPHSVEILR